MTYYLEALRKYALFTGRAGKREYWYFLIANVIIAFVLGTIESIFRPGTSINTSILGAVYNLIIFIPTLAVGMRRMHDIDKSGWLYFIPIYNLILACKEGTRGSNQYGEEPLLK